MPDSHMSQQSNLDIFDNFTSWTPKIRSKRNSPEACDLFSHSVAVFVNEETLQPGKMVQLSKLSQAFNHQDSQKRQVETASLLSDIARFQLFQGFDDWDWTF